MARRFWSALVVLCFVVVGLVAVAPSSSATTPSYNNIELAPELYVYTNGSVKSQTLDISTTWWGDIKQAYQRRMAYNPPGWPTNFISTVDDAIANGGSWGVVQVESYYGTEIRMFASDDPNVSCRMQTYSSVVWWLECFGSTPGYSFASADYITHNSYGNNGCGGGSCSDNGMNIYNAPTVFPAGGGSWGLDGSLLGSGQAKIFFLNADMVYPTDYTGDPIPSEFSPLEYVALGDSFSSGEGVEPFELGTDVADDPSTSGVDEENRCHRSEYAYPRLLADDPRLGLQLTDFVACSGATTDTVLNGGAGGGSWGEGAQVDALSTETDVVTITIGGNDVGFSRVLNDCTLLNEMPETWLYGQEAYDEHVCLNSMEDAESKIYGSIAVDGANTLDSVLDDVLTTVLGKVGVETRVIVVGYPNLMPEYEDIEGSCIWGASFGAGLTSLRSASEDEVNMLRHVTSLLNTQISAAVDRQIDDRLTFISPVAAFDGRELCRWDSYLYHINYEVQPNGHYHPNVSGQSAYMQLLSEVIG